MDHLQTQQCYASTTRALVVTFLLSLAVAQNFGPGTHDGCEDEGWKRVGGHCYYLPADATAVLSTAPRTQAAAASFCADLTLPRMHGNGSTAVFVNFTDTAELASFASHNSWEAVVGAAGAQYSGQYTFGVDTFNFWIGCEFNPATGLSTWSDGT
jgi:hypothetical protein